MWGFRHITTKDNDVSDFMGSFAEYTTKPRHLKAHSNFWFCFRIADCDTFFLHLYSAHVVAVKNIG